MQEGETRKTVKKRHDRRTLVKVLLVRPPRLQRAAGHVQHLGRLALGDPLGVQLAISCKQVSALEARPALVAIIHCHGACSWIIVATGYLPYRSPYHVRSGGLRMAR